MKHLKPLFIVLFCLSLSCATASAAPPACKRPEAAYSGTFQGVKAVGLAVMHHPGDFLEHIPPALEEKYLIDLFSSRIREHIMPYLEPNEECKIPDLIVFGKDYKSNERMWEFTTRPDTLTIQLNLRYTMRTYKETLGVYVLGFRYLRSGPSALKNWELLEWPEQTAFPENEPAEAVEEHVTKLAGHIFVLAPGSDSLSPGIGQVLADKGKHLKPMPYDKWIPLPPPPEEKRPSLDIVE